jgi:hypothetical protein
MSAELPPGRGKELPVDQARSAKLQHLAKYIVSSMPGSTGFVLLVYGQGPLATPGELLQYVSNSRREDVVQLLKEWLATMGEDSDYDRDIPPGQSENEQAFSAWWKARLGRGEAPVHELCRDAWNAGRASKV